MSILLTIIFYNYNKNSNLKNLVKGHFCEIKFQIKQDEKLNFFLKNQINYKNIEINKYYYQVINSYLHNKVFTNNYLNKLDKNILSGNYSYDKVNNKYYFDYIIDKKNPKIEPNLEAIKKDLEKNINPMAYMIYIEEIKKIRSELKAIKAENKFFKNKINFNFDTTNIPKQKIYIVQDFICKKKTFIKANIVIFFNLLILLIIYFYLYRKIN